MQMTLFSTKKVCTEDTHVDEDINLFKYDVQRVAEWCVANELTINIKKLRYNIS